MALLLLGALEVRGDLAMDLGRAVYPADSGSAVLEVSYDIPHTSLVFLKQDEGFQARFRIGLSLLDRRGDPVAGDAWLRTISVAEYERTVEKDSHALGTVSIELPATATLCRVEVSDLSSRRKAQAEFRVEMPSSDLRLRFFTSGEQNPQRLYGLGDTVDVRAELLVAGTDVDSLEFSVKEGRRLVSGGSRPVSDSGGRRSARFRYVVADSSGVARLGSGEYTVEVTGRDGDSTVAARQSFRVEVPFFYDDEAWSGKVDRLVWVANVSDMQRLKRLAPDEREQAWNDFWKELDPSPTTARNEKEEEYFERIEYADENFGRGDRGYRSDRGRVYVVYGPAEQVESRPFELDSNAYEIWYYYRLGLQFVFVDESGFGVYVLESPRFIDGY